MPGILSLLTRRDDGASRMSVAKWSLELRERFWFLPAVMCTAAVVVAEVVIWVDNTFPLDFGGLHPLIYRVGVDGSRTILGTIAGSVLTAASTTFSITMAVLALTSSSYGPRLVRNFMTDRGNQAVLGTFLSTFLYALLVLRSIRSTPDSNGDLVPHLAVNLAVVFAVFDIAVLVWFIHHISESIQISTLSGRVRDELRETIEGLYPDVGESAPPGSAHATSSVPGLPADWRRQATPVRTRLSGYVVSVDERHLMRLARKHDLTVVLECIPGDHLITDDVLCLVLRNNLAHPAPAGPPEEADEGIAATFNIGDARSPHQDVGFAVQQLVEMAVRALSPGTNDPFTAVNALDDLGSGLALMASRPVPSPGRMDEDGRLRLVAPPRELEDVLRSVYRYMRTYALAAPSVLHRSVQLAATVGSRAKHDSTRELLIREVRTLFAAFEATGPIPVDLAELREQVGRVEAELTSASAPSPTPIGS